MWMFGTCRVAFRHWEAELMGVSIRGIVAEILRDLTASCLRLLETDGPDDRVTKRKSETQLEQIAGAIQLQPVYYFTEIRELARRQSRYSSTIASSLLLRPVLSGLCVNLYVRAALIASCSARRTGRCWAAF